MGFAVLQYAMNTFDVNGRPGRGDFPPVDPSTAPAAARAGQGGVQGSTR